MITTTIWKYSFVGNSEIEIPKGARILHMDVQYNVPCIWALVDTTKKEFDTYRIYGTGVDIDNLHKLEYLKTFLLYDGKLVFHLFKVKQ